MLSLAILFVTGMASVIARPTVAQTPPSPAEKASTEASQTTASACGFPFEFVSSPRPDVEAVFLLGVAGASADDVWAVGVINNPLQQTLVEHWDGSQWEIMPSPSPGLDVNKLEAVAVISSDDVWAVGFFAGADYIYRPLAMHWDGVQWAVVPTPSPGGGRYTNMLQGITAVSSTNVWAVGNYYDGFEQTLILHWDGVQWSQTASPSPARRTNVLYAVTAVSASDVWAVGRSYETRVAPSRTLILHWDGLQWSVVPSPSPSDGGENELHAVTFVSANDVWAVGYTGRQSLVMHWDGRRWSRVSAPYFGDDRLNGVTAVPGKPNDVWAVGYIGDGPETRALHWDGLQWSIVRTAGGGYNGSVLYAVTMLPSGAVWTVGSEVVDQRAIGRIQHTWPFSDVNISDYYYVPINYMVSHRAVSGYNDCTFRPGNSATRGQFAKIIVQAEGWQIDTSGGPHFNDVPPDHSFYEYIETAYNRDILSGYRGEDFRPDNYVTRAQLCKMIVRAERWPVNTSGGPHFSDAPSNDAFYAFIETAYNRGVISGYSDGAFRPGASATRGQISKIVYRAVTQP